MNNNTDQHPILNNAIREAVGNGRLLTVELDNCQRVTGVVEANAKDWFYLASGFNVTRVFKDAVAFVVQPDDHCKNCCEDLDDCYC